MQQQGYGYDWTQWDNFINEKFPRPTNVRYQNWQPFLSPKGVWMAFYNTGYSDILVVNLETNEVVINEFYSHKDADPEKSWYKSHTNVSTYVPGYFSCMEIFKNKDDVTPTYFSIPDYETESAEERASYGELKFLPLAFNAWTIWGMDSEYYVDVLDLSKIDDGIIRKWQDVNYIITRHAQHVRDFIHHDIEMWSKDDISTDFKVLEERWKERFRINQDGIALYDMYQIKSKEDVLTKGYKLTEKNQWEINKDREIARKKNNIIK